MKYKTITFKDLNINLNLDSAQSLENIRVLINQETKEIWFVAKDILQILLDNPNPDVSNATKDLESDDLTRFKIVSTNSTDTRLKDTIIVSESGLYSLIMRSRKPIAKPFQRLVTKEILPQIRKNGFYLSPKLSEKQETQLLQIVQAKYDRRYIDLTRKAMIDFIMKYLVDEDYTIRQAQALLSSVYNHCHIATCQKVASQIVFDVYKNKMEKNSIETFNTLRKVVKIYKSDYTSAINFYDEEMLSRFGNYYEMILRKAQAVIVNTNIKPTPQLVARVIKLEAEHIVRLFSGLELGTKVKGVGRKKLNLAVYDLYEKEFISSLEEVKRTVDNILAQETRTFIIN